jgi:hypothetical protein
VSGENRRVAEFIECLNDGLLARHTGPGQLVQSLFEVIAQLIRNLLALPGRKTQALGEKFQIKIEFLFGHGAL